MAVDRFSELSAERFRQIDEGQLGNRVLFFPYQNYGSDAPSRLAGLWLSNEFDKKQLETAHYMPDLECGRALEESAAFCARGSVWLGLSVEIIEVDPEPVARVVIPEFLLNEYAFLAISEERSLAKEIEDRFSVVVSTDK